MFVKFVDEDIARVMVERGMRGSVKELGPGAPPPSSTSRNRSKPTHQYQSSGRDVSAGKTLLWGQSCASLRRSPNGRPVHFFATQSQFFFCLTLRRPPSTYPCRSVLGNVSDDVPEPQLPAFDGSEDLVVPGNLPRWRLRNKVIRLALLE